MENTRGACVIKLQKKLNATEVVIGRSKCNWHNYSEKKPSKIFQSLKKATAQAAVNILNVNGTEIRPLLKNKRRNWDFMQKSL